MRAIRKREAQDIAERKKSLAAMLANVAELGAVAWRKDWQAALRDAAIGTGIAVDKVLALTGQSRCGPDREHSSCRRQRTRGAPALHAAGRDTRAQPGEGTQSREDARVTFLSLFISLAVADRRVIPVRV